jgi:BioD-like phosphotransacetylase family protein
MSLGKLKSTGVFVTATDTSVGKTTVASGLVGFLKHLGINVGVMKPVASGAIECDSGKLISQDAAGKVFRFDRPLGVGQSLLPCRRSDALAGRKNRGRLD